MIDNEIGSYFPPAVRSFGYILLVVGILGVVINPVLGLILAAVGLAVALLKTGVQIDGHSKKMKAYTGFFNLKFGSWESMDGLTDIGVLRKRITTTAFSRANRPATTSDDTVFDVCLMDSAHRTKRVVQRLADADNATQQAKQLSEQLGLTYATYSPEISAATRARRK